MSGQFILLNTDNVFIGRSTDDFKTDIPSESNFVSRIHLFLDRNLKLMDMRSINGTTINAEFLPYGSSRIIEDGDFITLAGTQLYYFSIVDQSWFPFFQSPRSEPAIVSKEAWSLLIDGSTKRIVDLTSDRYWVSESKGELEVATTKTNDTNLEFWVSPSGNLTAVYRGSPNKLFLWAKGNEYQYVKLPLPLNEEFEVLTRVC